MTQKIILYCDGSLFVIVSIVNNVFDREKLLDWYAQTYDWERERLSCSHPIQEVEYKP